MRTNLTNTHKLSYTFQRKPQRFSLLPKPHTHMLQTVTTEEDEKEEDTENPKLSTLRTAQQSRPKKP